MKLKYFQIEEFACPCCKKADMKEDFLVMLDKARELAETPFVITSGFRCEKHNREVGGKDNSSHLKGYAADISALTSDKRYKIVYGLISAGFKRIGIGKEFIHADCDPELPKGVIWIYY